MGETLDAWFADYLAAETQPLESLLIPLAVRVFLWPTLRLRDWLWEEWIAGNQQVSGRFALSQWVGEGKRDHCPSAALLFYSYTGSSNLNHISLVRLWQIGLCRVPENAPGCGNVVSFHVLSTRVPGQQLPKSKQRERPSQCLRDVLAPFSASLMSYQSLCRTQYGNCIAWRFAIIKHIFNDVTPGWKRSAGQPG